MDNKMSDCKVNTQPNTIIKCFSERKKTNTLVQFNTKIDLTTKIQKLHYKETTKLPSRSKKGKNIITPWKPVAPTCNEKL
jgi:hypothetical protein